MIRLPVNRLQGAFAATSTARAVSVFFVVVVLLFSLQWFGEDIPALLSGKIPSSVTENGLLTNPVHVLDLGLLLPAMFITAILLWRGKLLGSFLALPLVVFSILTGVGILATFLVMGMNGMPTSLVVELLFAVIVLVSLVLSVLFGRDVQEQRTVSFV